MGETSPLSPKVLYRARGDSLGYPSLSNGCVFTVCSVCIEDRGITLLDRWERARGLSLSETICFFVFLCAPGSFVVVERQKPFLEPKSCVVQRKRKEELQLHLETVKTNGFGLGSKNRLFSRLSGVCIIFSIVWKVFCQGLRGLYTH